MQDLCSEMNSVSQAQISTKIQLEGDTYMIGEIQYIYVVHTEQCIVGPITTSLNVFYSYQMY